jgi:hypothetical protein
VRQFAARHAEFERRGISLVRVFYSPRKALEFAFGEEPLPFPVLADPDRQAYQAYGVEKSFWSLFKASAYSRVKTSRAHQLKPRWRDAIRDGFTGLPADFLVGGDQRILRVHYGTNHTDSLSPDHALSWCENLERLSG